MGGGGANVQICVYIYDLLKSSITQMNRKVTGCQFFLQNEETSDDLLSKAKERECVFFTGSVRATSDKSKSSFRCFVFPKQMQPELSEIQAVNSKKWVKVLDNKSKTQLHSIVLTMPKNGEHTLRRITIDAGELEVKSDKPLYLEVSMYKGPILRVKLNFQIIVQKNLKSYLFSCKFLEDVVIYFRNFIHLLKEEVRHCLSYMGSKPKIIMIFDDKCLLKIYLNYPQGRIITQEPEQYRNRRVDVPHLYAEGYLVNIFVQTKAIKESCSDKTIYFDLPIDEEYDEGHVLLIMRGPLTKYPTIRVFGEKEKGIHTQGVTFRFRNFLVSNFFHSFNGF